MCMNNRTVEIKVRLNRKEADALNKRVKKSRLSREPGVLSESGDE